VLGTDFTKVGGIRRPRRREKKKNDVKKRKSENLGKNAPVGQGKRWFQRRMDQTSKTLTKKT